MARPPAEPAATPRPVSLGRHERLLVAALHLFDEVPFDDMTVDVVADRAGVARGLVAYYFGSKAGLHAAVSERFSRDVHQGLLSVDSETPWSPPDVEAFLAVLQEHPVGMQNLTGSVHAARGTRDTPMNQLTVARVLRASALLVLKVRSVR